MNNPVSVRAAAARGLKRVVFDGVSLRQVLADCSTALNDARDRALLHAILFDCSRWYLRLKALLQHLMEQSLERREPQVHCLLITGLAQLQYLGLPDYAAVDATVAAVRELKRPHLAGLVNAILRRYQREADTLNALLDNDLVTRYSLPRWLTDWVQTDWPEEAPAVFTATNTPAPLMLRVNRRVTTLDACRKTLAEAKFDAKPHPSCADALVLESSTDVTRLPGYEQGAFSIQDGAAQLSADLLNLQPGLRVLDACAAPGGKACHILERADVDLLALDRDKARLPRIAQNLRRLNLHAELRAADASKPETWWDGQPFDRILLDAPCSATGIIRRQPDIKLHRRKDDLAALTAEQTRLLNALWPLLKRGGRLVYATCSILRCENENQIDAFLARNGDAFARDECPASWGRAAGVGRQNLPGELQMDGFFYAVVDKLP